MSTPADGNVRPRALCQTANIKPRVFPNCHIKLVEARTLLVVYEVGVFKKKIIINNREVGVLLKLLVLNFSSYQPIIKNTKYNL